MIDFELHYEDMKQPKPRVFSGESLTVKYLRIILNKLFAFVNR